MRLLFIDPGTFRSELSLQQAATAPDGAGGHTEDWQEVASLFALVEPMGVKSRFGAGQALETATHRITLRFRDDVRSGMRLVRGGRIFEIVNVADADGTERYLVCLAREEGR